MANFTWGGKIAVAGPIPNDKPSDFSTGGKVVRDASGRLWCVSWKTGFTANDQIMHYSDDNGASWSSGEVISNKVDVADNQPNIVIDLNGKPVVPLANSTIGGRYVNFYRRDGDDTTPNWTRLSGAQIDVVNASYWDGQKTVVIQNRATGDWHVFYVRSDSPKAIYHRVSTDDLATWSAENTIASYTFDVGSRTSANLSPFFDSLGVLYLGVYSNGFASVSGAAQVYKWSGLAWSRFDSSTNLLSVNNNQTFGATFALSDDESQIVCFVGDGTSSMKWFSMPFSSGGSWTENTFAVGSHSTRVGPRLTISADGVMHLLYGLTTTSTAVLYRRSIDEGSSWSNEEQINTGSTAISVGFFLRPEDSLQAPDAGVVVVGFAANTEVWFLGSDDLSWPAVPTGTLVSRIVLRAIGPLPDVVRPLTLPSVLPSALLNNWTGEVSVESTYQTDVVASAAELAEERRSLADRPTRIMKVRFTGMSRGVSAKILGNLLRNANQRMPVPLYCDRSEVSAASSGTDLYCDTTSRRFFKGSRVVVWEDGDVEPTSVQYTTVLKVAPDRLIVADTLSKTYPVGASVFPCIDVEISLRHTMSPLTDANVEATVAFNEVFGWSALPPTVYFNPSEFPSIDGVPVLDVPPDWNGSMQSDVLRGGSRYASGRAEIVYTAGGRPQMQHRLTYTELDRASFWKLVRFFDSRRGRARAFWVVNPSILFVPTAVSTSYIDVQAYGDATDIEDFLSYLALVDTSDVITVLGITGVTDNGDGTYRIAHDGDTSGETLSSIDLLTSAHLVRMAGDSMVERWRTDGVASVTFDMIDLLSESEVEVPNFE